MNEIYEKYNALSKEHEAVLEEVAALKAHRDILVAEAKEVDNLRRLKAEMDELLKRQQSEIEMLKECIVKMEMERHGVS